MVTSTDLASVVEGDRRTSIGISQTVDIRTIVVSHIVSARQWVGSRCAVDGNISAKRDGVEGAGAVHIASGLATFAVTPSYTGGVRHARHGAAAVVVAGECSNVFLVTDDSSAAVDIGDDDALSDAVGDGVAPVLANNTSIAIAAVQAVGHSEGGAADASAHGGALISTHNAAVALDFALSGMDAHVVTHSAVLNGGNVGSSYDTSGTMAGRDTGIYEVDTLDGAVFHNRTKKTKIGGIGFIDTYATDGVSLTAESATEGIIIGTNGDVVVLGAGAAVPVGGVGESDVGHLQEGEIFALVAAVHESGQTDQVFMRFNKVVTVFLLKVIDGVGEVSIEGAEITGSNTTTQAFACKVLDGAADTSNVEVTSSILRNGSAESQHVGAGTCLKGHWAPRGGKRGVGASNNLAEGHTHINGIALGMTAWVNRYRTFSGVGAVNGLDMGLDVLSIPRIAVIAAGVEADIETGEFGRNDKSAVGSTTHSKDEPHNHNCSP